MDRRAASRSTRASSARRAAAASRSSRPTYASLYFVRSPAIAIRAVPDRRAVVPPVLIASCSPGSPSPRVALPGGRWPRMRVADRLLAMAPITTMRQVYLLWCYALLGVSVLAKGPPGVAVVVAVGVFHVACSAAGARSRRRVRAQARPPAHARRSSCPGTSAMWLKDGLALHQRVPVHAHPRPRDRGSRQLARHVRVLHVAARPRHVAVGRARAGRARRRLCRARTATREGRVRFLVVLWAIAAVAVFCLVTDQVPSLHPPGGAGARHPRRVLPRRPARAPRPPAPDLRRARHRHRPARRARPRCASPSAGSRCSCSATTARGRPPSRGRSIRPTASSRSASSPPRRSRSPARGAARRRRAHRRRRPRDLRLGAPGLHADRRHALGHARGDAHLLRAAHDLRREARVLRRARALRRLERRGDQLDVRDVHPRRRCRSASR